MPLAKSGQERRGGEEGNVALAGNALGKGRG